MDSWTDKQLQAMKLGGNQACNDYLQQKTGRKISARTPIRQKYDNPTAQLYKEILKARVEGRPEPTSLPLAVPKTTPNSNGSMNSMSSSSAGSQDPNGMERLLGETDQQYVARQTRLREEAKARMAAKFGSGGLSNSGAAAGRMQGIGSDARYNPQTGGYGGGNATGSSDFDVNSLVAGFGSVLGSAVHSAKSLADESTLQSLKSTGASFWGGLTSTVSNVAASMTTPQDESDGLADLQRQIAAQKSSQPSKYSGFGSDSSSVFMNNTTEPARSSVASATPPSSYANSGDSVQEAPGLPGEDRNGVERLTGESDAQYVMRQTRLRDEARARMAAKFGGGGLSGTGSSAAPRSSHTPPPTSAPAMAPPASRSAPSSGNFPRNKTPPKMMNSNDFFSSFGS
jgi:hypothetical protein